VTAGETALIPRPNQGATVRTEQEIADLMRACRLDVTAKRRLDRTKLPWTIAVAAILEWVLDGDDAVGQSIITLVRAEQADALKHANR
jgi:hypothetical protein